MKNVKYVLAGSLLLLATAANAIVPAAGNKEKIRTETTGDELAYNCLGNVPRSPLKGREKEVRANLCTSFIEGWDRAMTAFSTERFCSPIMLFKDMSIVYVDYIISHRDAGKLPAAKALLIALQDRWPCAREAHEGGSVDEAVRRAQEEISKEK